MIHAVDETSGTITIEAPAKVNLHLAVGAVRTDGYHEVDTVLQAVELVDRLTLKPSDVFHFACLPDLGIHTQDNLVWKAAMLFAQRTGHEPLVRIEVVKAIPAGAGLGGGSSDAAAIIAGLSALWAVDRASAVVLEVSRTIGSDVPFFLEGGTARFAGRGDVLTQRIHAPAFDVVIMKPPLGVSTATAYAQFGHTPNPPHEPDALIAACESGSVERIAAALSNNMELVAVNLVPEVADALAYLRGADGVLGGTVAGSGSAVFGICADPAAADRAARGARERGWWSVATRSRGTGVRVQALKEAR